MASPAFNVCSCIATLLIFVAGTNESNALDLTNQRPEGLFSRAAGESPICAELLVRLNTQHKSVPPEGWQETLLHTGLETRPHYERYFTRGGDLRQYEAWKFNSPNSQDSVTLFRADGWKSGYPAQHLFYAPTATIEARKDGDGILPWSFVGNIRRVTEPENTSQLSPITARTFGPRTSSYGPGRDIYTNSIVDVDGKLLVLLAPWQFEDGISDLTQKFSVYAVNVPMTASEPLCEFVHSMAAPEMTYWLVALVTTFLSVVAVTMS
jgi:hypothetical protein